MEEVKGTYLVTADHGNAEDMVQRDKKTKQALLEDGKPRMLTSHTLNPVSSHLRVSCLEDGRPCMHTFVHCPFCKLTHCGNGFVGTGQPGPPDLYEKVSIYVCYCDHTDGCNSSM